MRLEIQSSFSHRCQGGRHEECLAGSWEMLKQLPHILIVSEGEEKVGLINDEHLQAVSESQVLLDKGKTLSGAIRRSFE